MRTIPGMKDFFGKKLGGHVVSALTHMSPVEMGSVRSTLDRVYASEGMIGAGKAAFQHIKSGLSAAKGQYTFGNWFSGLNVGESATSLSESLRRTRAAWRIGTGVTLGVAGVSQFVAPNNPFGVAAKSAVQIGGYTMAAAAIGTQSPYGAMAFAGWAGLNMLRPGDNTGPF